MLPNFYFFVTESFFVESTFAVIFVVSLETDTFTESVVLGVPLEPPQDAKEIDPIKATAINKFFMLQ